LTLLPRVVEILDASGIRHCLIGATAAAMHGIVRATLDVDLLTADGRVLQPETWRALGESTSVELHRGDLEDSLLGTARLTAGEDSPVDVVVGAKQWMAEIIERSVRVQVLGTTLGQPRLADLVLLKLDAGSVRDLADVREMVDSGVEPELMTEVEGRLAALPDRCRRRLDQALRL
jgi:predicted nucleotidyltransferase